VFFGVMGLIWSLDDANAPYVWRQLSYGELHRESQRCAEVLRAAGVQKGDRVLFLVPPSPETLITFFALLEVEAVPLSVNPLIGFWPFLRAIKSARPSALIAPLFLYPLLAIFPSYFASIQLRFVTSRPPVSIPSVTDTLIPCVRVDAKTLKYPAITEKSTPPSKTANDDSDFINDPIFSSGILAFTSGSTGHPKPVHFTPSMFTSQRDIIFASQPLLASPNTTALVGVVPWVILIVASGTTVALPTFNIAKPAHGRPTQLLRTLRDIKEINVMIASPVVWTNLAGHCVENGMKVPGSVELGLCGGMTLSLRNHQRILDALAEGSRFCLLYGSTEAQPIAGVYSHEILDAEHVRNAKMGGGYCAGKVADGCELKIMRLEFGPVPEFDPKMEMPTGEYGEIILTGSTVSTHYADKSANHRSKITEHLTLPSGAPTTRIWHRTGDTGYLDSNGFLWFCGRAAHTLRTHHNGDRKIIPSACVEIVVDEHPAVYRSALVGIGEDRENVTPLLIIELKDRKGMGEEEKKRIAKEILERVDGTTRFRGLIRHVWFYAGTFPTDATHNSKIRRELLCKEVGVGELEKFRV
ncbi:hypothetical protein HK102_001177, partial [Quaeritorhiza haematococci]